MKKTLLLLLFILSTLLANAANEYKNTYITSDVKVTDMSTETYYGPVYKYKLEYTQKGYNASYSTWYSTGAVLIIYPEAHSLAGTYRLSDNTVDRQSYVVNGSSYRYVTDYTGKPTVITITDEGDGYYRLAGDFRTKSGSSYYYYYYDATSLDNVFKPVMAEKEIYGDNISCEDHIAQKGYIELDLNTYSGDFLAVGFPTDTFDVPAGRYEVNSSYAKGTIMPASGAWTGGYPVPSYYCYYDDYYDEYVEYVSGGYLDVAFSDDGKAMTLVGAVTTSFGNEIAVDAIGANPFYKEPEPETITLDAESVSLVRALDRKSFELSIAAKNAGENCPCYVKINSSDIAGLYRNNEIGAWTYVGTSSNFIDKSKDGNYVSITSGDSTGDYVLTMSVTVQDKNTYIIENVPFHWEVENPYADEPEPSEFAVEFDSEPAVYVQNDTVILVFESTTGHLDLAFVADSGADLLPCRYLVREGKTAGTIYPSKGNLTGDPGDETPSLLGIGNAITGYDPYFITGGYVDVSYTGTQVRMDGELTTHNGSKISLQAKGKNSFFTNPLPENVMSGHIEGTEATYILAYDVKTGKDSRVYVTVMLMADPSVSGLKPQIKDGAVFVDMNPDAVTGVYTYVSSTAVKGSARTFELRLAAPGKTTQVRNINYTVE